MAARPIGLVMRRCGSLPKTMKRRLSKDSASDPGESRPRSRSDRSRVRRATGTKLFIARQRRPRARMQHRRASLLARRNDGSGASSFAMPSQSVTASLGDLMVGGRTLPARTFRSFVPHPRTYRRHDHFVIFIRAVRLAHQRHARASRRYSRPLAEVHRVRTWGACQHRRSGGSGRDDYGLVRTRARAEVASVLKGRRV